MAAQRLPVVIADDDEEVRSALHDLLDDTDDLQVVAEAATAQETVEACRTHEPAVVLLDLDMPGDGLVALREITRSCPSTTTVVLTAWNSEEVAQDAMDSGAAQVIVKGSGDDLVDAIRRAAAR